MSEIIRIGDEIFEESYQRTTEQEARVRRGLGPYRRISTDYATTEDPETGETIVTVDARLLNALVLERDGAEELVEEDRDAVVVVDSDEYEDVFTAGELAFEVSTSTSVEIMVDFAESEDALVESDNFEVTV